MFLFSQLHLPSLASGIVVIVIIWIIWANTRKKPVVQKVTDKLRKINDNLRQADVCHIEMSREIQKLYKIFTDLEK